MNPKVGKEIDVFEKSGKHKSIAFIGGGLIGVDIATALIPLNIKVIIVKRTTDFGEDMEMNAKLLSLKMMKEKELFSVIIPKLKKLKEEQSMQKKMKRK